MTENKKKALLLEEFLPYRLSYLVNMIGIELARLYTDDFGITHSEWRVMAVLGHSPGVSAGYVAEKTAMDKVAVSRAINNMIKNELIKRSFAKEDRRRSMLSLTNKGGHTYLKIVPLVQNYERDLLHSLTEQERKTLNIVADKLTHYVKEQF